MKRKSSAIEVSKWAVGISLTAHAVIGSLARDNNNTTKPTSHRKTQLGGMFYSCYLVDVQDVSPSPRKIICCDVYYTVFTGASMRGETSYKYWF